MADWNDQRTGVGYEPGIETASVPSTVRDGGLRKYMLSIYNYMTSGVLLSGIIALVAANTGLTVTLFSNAILAYAVILSPLAIVLAVNFGLRKFSAGALQVMFWSYAALMGLSLSTIFYQFEGAEIAVAFFGAAAGFAGLSLWGYTTKKDLSGMGTFLIVGVVGLLVVMLANLFIQSGPLAMAINLIGVGIFAGLAAYYNQMLKNIYREVRGTEWQQKMVIFGALSLYITFVNMFIFLLNLVGGRE